MAQLSRNTPVKATSAQAKKGRFNPARYFRNRKTFSALRKELRAHHSYAFGYSPGSVYSENRAREGGVSVSISGFSREGQTIRISEGKRTKAISVEHPSVFSRASNFIQSLPVCAVLGGGICALSAVAFRTVGNGALAKAFSGAMQGASTALFGTADKPSLFFTGAIIGTAFAVALSLAREIRSIKSPSNNKALYGFVKHGDKHAVSALAQHLEEERFTREATKEWTLAKF
ncbi:hypothetical protein JW721_00965 [Candidatus Micrarchaeota archaeon]|nr:hypothetical protein [Candidatus Micrarchaeota archaeon]